MIRTLDSSWESEKPVRCINEHKSELSGGSDISLSNPTVIQINKFTCGWCKSTFELSTIKTHTCTNSNGVTITYDSLFLGK